MMDMNTALDTQSNRIGLIVGKIISGMVMQQRENALQCCRLR